MTSSNLRFRAVAGPKIEALTPLKTIKKTVILTAFVFYYCEVTDHRRALDSYSLLRSGVFIFTPFTVKPFSKQSFIALLTLSTI